MSDLVGAALFLVAIFLSLREAALRVARAVHVT
jgi:hypothetical protein